MRTITKHQEGSYDMKLNERLKSIMYRVNTNLLLPYIEAFSQCATYYSSTYVASNNQVIVFIEALSVRSRALPNDTTP